MLTLHIVQAKFGDSMIIQYGNAQPKYILIDGGPPGVFKNFLSGEITRIVGAQGKLEAVVVSHIDSDHIKGVLDLVTELKKQRDQSKPEMVAVKEIWHNSFSKTIDLDGTIVNRLDTVLTFSSQNNVNMEHAGIVPESVKEGNKVRTFANDLGIPVNKSTNNNFFSLENTPAKVVFDNLSFIVTGPTTENLTNLREEWDEWLTNTIQQINDGVLSLSTLSDESVPNLSSITFLAEADGKKILFTGDARTDHVVEGLKKRNLLKYGKLHVDVIKVPHHGSDRNSDRDFYERITADTYVISADGKYNNPDYATMCWIIEEAEKQKRKIHLIITNETPATKKILKDYDQTQYQYKLTYIAAGKNSFELKLA